MAPSGTPHLPLSATRHSCAPAGECATPRGRGRHRAPGSFGKWALVKTIKTSASGAYSYTTPTLHSKTKYRVAYDGSIRQLGPGIARHFSAVSSVRTGWPR